MSKWVSLLDHPCTCKAASQSGDGENGSKALSPGCHSPHTMAWLGVCFSSMWHKAAGCTLELGKPLLLMGCSSLLFQEDLYCASPQTCQKQ